MPSVLQADRNRPEVIGMKLPALLLSKIVVPESFRGSGFRWSVLLPEDLGPLSAVTREKVPIKYETRRRAPGTITHWE
jgi:hypothetical protein